MDALNEKKQKKISASILFDYHENIDVFENNRK